MEVGVFDDDRAPSTRRSFAAISWVHFRAVLCQPLFIPHIAFVTKQIWQKSKTSAKFAMDADSFREFGKATIDYLADYLENIRERSVLFYISYKKHRKLKFNM